MRKQIKINKNTLFYGIVGLFFLFSQSCNQGVYSDELSGDYFYENRGTIAKEIVCHKPRKKEIYANVIRYGYNRNFIIAEQLPNIKGYKQALGYNFRDDLKKYPTNSLEEMKQSEKEADSFIKNDSYYKSIFAHDTNYWIISNKDTTVYGPLTKNDYLRKRDELGVPKSLELKNAS